MVYYTSWQDALTAFIKKYGHNYRDAYNLVMEFEQQLHQNSKGAYFMVGGDTKWEN